MKAEQVTEEGHYWYQDGEYGWKVVEVVQVGDYLVAYFCGSDIDERMDRLDGPFVGPIEPPNA